MVRKGGLNPHAFRRHPLKMVCLPVPPLPHSKNYLIRNYLHRHLKPSLRRLYASLLGTFRIRTYAD